MKTREVIIVNQWVWSWYEGFVLKLLSGDNEENKQQTEVRQGKCRGLNWRRCRFIIIIWVYLEPTEVVAGI